MKKMDFKHEVFSIISQFTGQDNIITVNVALIDFVDDLETGLFLSQVIYWSDRTKRTDGFFYKSAKEWYEEVRLSGYAVTKATKKLKSMGILETKVKKANGNPTTHYKFNKEAFVQQFIWFLRNQQNEIVNSQEGNFENEDSLTDITTDIKTDITDNKGLKKDLSLYKKDPPLSFEDYLNTNTVDPEAAEVIEHYLDLYLEVMEDNHPRLKKSQWQHVVENIFYTTHPDYGTTFDLSSIDLKKMINRHFTTEYKNCDYNILHFMSDGVKVKRMYEVAY